jgi:hypothetical protein
MLVGELDRRLVVSVQNLLRDKNISGDTYRRIRSDWDEKKNDIARRLVQYNQQSDDKVITLMVEKFIHDCMEYTPDSPLTQEKNKEALTSTDKTIKSLVQQVSMLTQQVNHILGMVRPLTAFPQGYRPYGSNLAFPGYIPYNPFQNQHGPFPIQSGIFEDKLGSTSPSVTKTDTTNNRNEVEQNDSKKATGSKKTWSDDRCREFILKSFRSISHRSVHPGDKIVKKGDLTTRLSGRCRAAQIQRVLDQLVSEKIISLLPDKNKLTKRYRLHKQFAE